MSTVPPSDPRREPSAQTDRALLGAHSEDRPSATPDRFAWVPTAVLISFTLLLCIAAVYLRRHAGGFSPIAYDEANFTSGAGSSTPKAVDMAAFGKKQYLSACVTCHQPTGLGLPGVYPTLAGSEWVNGSEERVIRIVLHGLTGKVTVAGQTMNGTIAMPAFGKVPGGGYNWRDDQIAVGKEIVRVSDRVWKAREIVSGGADNLVCRRKCRTLGSQQGLRPQT